MTVKTILVPLDGSRLAERALPIAVTLARAAGSRLVLVHATCTIDESLNKEPPLDAAVERVQAAGVKAEPLVCHPECAEQAGEAICEAARVSQADLIVMSTHGRSGLGRWLYGSVADDILRHATVPVLVAPPHLERSWPGDRPLRVLVPLDSSKLSEEVLESLRDLAGRLHLRLVLLRVMESVDFVKPHGDECNVCRAARARGEDPDIEPVRVRWYVEKVASRLRGHGMDVESEMHIGHPTSIIAKVAAEREIDPIAMATHGRGGLERVVMGSVATETLRRATVPLLLVRPVAQKTTRSMATSATPRCTRSPEAAVSARPDLSRTDVAL